MKKFGLHLTRIIVGVLFIFSGLIKANDPLGLSYKMQEFFEVWHVHGVDHFTLPLSVLMIVFEIVAGVAVLLGWNMRIFSWLLLWLILFFSFLTGYAYLSGKVRECGCFGNCIPLTAGQSFVKDLFLLGLILIIFSMRNRISGLLRGNSSLSILILAAVFSFAFQWYVLQHLPIVDCLPYKVGADIAAGMKVPAGAVPDSTVISFVYRKNGQELEFTADKFPADFNDSYVFVRRYDKLIRKGNAEPSIKDFILLTASGTDSTQALLQTPGYMVLLFAQDMPDDRPSWNKAFNIILTFCKQKHIPRYIVTADQEQAEAYILHNGLLADISALRCDATAIKTAARTNPALYLLKRGIVLEKWGVADFESAINAIGSLPSQQAPELGTDSLPPGR